MVGKAIDSCCFSKQNSSTSGSYSRFRKAGPLKTHPCFTSPQLFLYHSKLVLVVSLLQGHDTLIQEKWQHYLITIKLIPKKSKEIYHLSISIHLTATIVILDTPPFQDHPTRFTAKTSATETSLHPLSSSAPNADVYAVSVAADGGCQAEGRIRP